METIDRAWFERHPLLVAFDLLGKTLVVDRDISEETRTSGRIVEVEAYADPDDLASHSGTLKAARPLLYGEVGHLYMYRSYGIHTMVNVVAHEVSTAGAILIRAVEPGDGIDEMQRRRSTAKLRPLTSGPGVLCQAMDLRLSDNGFDLVTGATIRLEAGAAPHSVMAGPRIGISKSIDHPWRLFDADSVFVSSHRRGTLVHRNTLQVEINDQVQSLHPGSGKSSHECPHSLVGDNREDRRR